ncbi:mitochondrial ribosomal protein S5 precursor, putative [Plasmodium malariae]|uniref:Mitochondrial ribosomal protein S5, putative n=1 Tax=Plasmodium malariae TaxID=5858 RepID=A0A1D3TEF1_PLAMA|nr:mitochondrial ribosomal protein S5 precursor, putative [Plasmodium malariae]SCP03332.1 mitochondrial ribosomal protein S5 precursor, putative [Plasmodium malariae]
MIKNILKKRKYCDRFLLLNSRCIHNSHLNKTLKNIYNEKLRDKYLDNIYNNEININTINKNIKHKKIDYLRQLIYEEVNGDEYLLSENILEEIKKNKNKYGHSDGNSIDNDHNSNRYSDIINRNSSSGASYWNNDNEAKDEGEKSRKNHPIEQGKEEMSESKYKQAIRIYNLLKLNDKASIFDEDVFMNIDSKINHDIYEFAQKNLINYPYENIDSPSRISKKNDIDVQTVCNDKTATSESLEYKTEGTSDSSINNDPINNDPINNDPINNDPINNDHTFDESNFMNITKMNLPIFNPSSFCLAIECLTNYICDDLIILFGDLVDKKKIPEKGENDRLYKFINLLCNFFSLEKKHSDVDRWMLDVYKKIKSKLPSKLRNIKDEYIQKWIKGHLERVLLNEKYKNETLYKEKYYNLGNDFVYDNLPLNNTNVMDNKINFSTNKLTYYFKTIIEFLLEKKIDNDLEEQLKMMFLNLKKIGLQNWLKMDVKDFEKYLLRNKNNNFLEISENDKYVSYLMLKCASRNITDFFFYEEFSPFYLFQEKPKNSIEEKINSLQENKHISDDELKKMIYTNQSAITITGSNNINDDEYNDMDIDLFLEKEKKYNMNRSLITYNFDENTNSYNYKYKQIPNTIYDQNTNKYIREKETIDPMLKLNEMRSSILEVKRMMSMTKDGRVYYIRIIIIIGNGKGVYGYGVGFGKNIKEARNSALLNSISNIDFIDYNYKNCILNFPVSGQEYSSHVKIIPRPLGKGLKMNRKYLPLGYILGLDNVKISFSGSNKWMSRIKALKRCLNKIVSIKTLCKMTGKKYVCHFAPHYCTSHWPDYWFKNILKEYQYKIQRIQKKRSMVCRKNFRSNISKIPEEVRPDFTPYTWKTPIQKYVELQKLKRYIDNNIFRTNVF